MERQWHSVAQTAKRGEVKVCHVAAGAFTSRFRRMLGTTRQRGSKRSMATAARPDQDARWAADVGRTAWAPLCMHGCSEDRAEPRRCGHQRRVAGPPKAAAQGGSSAGSGWARRTCGAVIAATGPKRPKPCAARILKQNKGCWLSLLRLNQFYYPKANTTSYPARQPSPPKSNRRKRYANANKDSSWMCRFANRASTPVTQRVLANIGKFLGEHRGLQLNYHSYHVQVHT
jgi:hypothetical protein